MFPLSTRAGALQRPLLLVPGNCPGITLGKPRVTGMQPSIPCRGKAEVPATALSKQRCSSGATFRVALQLDFKCLFCLVCALPFVSQMKRCLCAK